MVDALTPELSGIGRYCWELAKGVPRDTRIDEVRFRHSGQWIPDPSSLLGSTKFPVGRHPKMLRSVFRALDRRKLRGSLVHAPNYFLPGDVDSGIITIHDLSVFKYPQSHPASRLEQFEKNFRSSVERALHIITDTEAVREELIDYAGLSPDFVTAVHLGYDDRYRPYAKNEIAETLAHYHLEYGRYGLCISALEPRKKIEQLITAWSAMRSDIRDQYPLAIAGPAGWLNDDLQVLIRQGEHEGWLRHLGFVPELDLPYIYGGAALFVYPSIYEGFGLPPLEAMASGVPVIVAEQCCAREICGNAGMYIDPDDHLSFIQNLHKGLEDKDWQNHSIRNGLQISSGYSWERCVENTVAIYLRAGIL